jgi:hypothetical protein
LLTNIQEAIGRWLLLQHLRLYQPLLLQHHLLLLLLLGRRQLSGLQVLHLQERRLSHRIGL